MYDITKDRVLAVLAHHVGDYRGAHVRDLAAEIVAGSTTPGDERHVRKVIEQLRREGQHICAHPSKGYYMAANAEDVEATCKYLYNRAMSSLTQVAAMNRVSLPDLRGQLGLRL